VSLLNCFDVEFDLAQVGLIHPTILSIPNYAFPCIHALIPATHHRKCPNEIAPPRRVAVLSTNRNPEETQIMAKQTAEHHTRAAESHGNAQKHHTQAAKHHTAGNHEKAAHHATVASGHERDARKHSDEATKSHKDTYGDKE
jgi:hypothetical protein